VWQDVVAAGRSFSFGGLSITSNQLSVSTDGKHIYFAIDLPLDYERRIAAFKGDIRLVVADDDAPMVAVRSFQFPTIPSEGFASAAIIALRNCLPR